MSQTELAEKIFIRCMTKFISSQGNELDKKILILFAEQSIEAAEVFLKVLEKNK